MSTGLLASLHNWQRNSFSGVQSCRLADLSPADKQCCSTKMSQLAGSPMVDLLGNLGPTDTIDVDKIKDLVVKEAYSLAPLSISQRKILFPKENAHTTASFSSASPLPTWNCTRLRRTMHRSMKTRSPSPSRVPLENTVEIIRIRCTIPPPC